MNKNKSENFPFKVDDADLQDEPLQIRIMDHDTYSANDAIGKVNISLNPLLLPSLTDGLVQQKSGKGSVMSGWLPIYDTSEKMAIFITRKHIQFHTFD